MRCVSKNPFELILKSEYLELSHKMSEYVCGLLEAVNGRDELDICLNKTGKETEEKYKLLGRMELALQYQEMPVGIQFLKG